jgi:hypothetical protein
MLSLQLLQLVDLAVLHKWNEVELILSTNQLAWVSASLV